MQVKELLPKLWPTVVALIAMLLASILYFSPQLEGKEIPAHDVISNRGMTQELRTYEAETGKRSLWTNSMFGGMPAYQIYAPERGNLLRYVEQGLRLGFDRPIGYFFTIMIGLFVLLRVLGVGVWLSMIGAIAFSLSTNHMTLFEAGHMTKLRAISFMAPTLAGLILLFRGRYVSGLALFALSLGLNIHANHPQMTYYLAAACGCFVIFRLINDLGEGQLARFGKALVLSFLGAGLAVGASYSKLSTTIEYGKDTMRGAPILEAPASAQVTSSSEVDGLEWTYAMQWSNGIIDVFASFIPGMAGGSNSVVVASDGPLAKAFRSQGARLPKDFGAPLYHGELPSTSGPAYFGVIAVYLFILGMFWLPPGWRYFFGSAVILTLLISMGKHAEWLNRPLFNLVPYFNNFRAPSSATSITAMLVAAGGLTALCKAFMRDERVSLNSFYIGTGITAGILLISALFGASFTDFASPGDARLEQAGYPIDAIYAERITYLKASAFRGLAFVLAAAAALYFWLRGSASKVVVLAIIGIVSIADVWSVSREYIGTDDFKSSRQVAAIFTPRPVDQQILADKDLSYRVIDFSVNTFNDAKVSYFHKSVGGYHAAKLQRAQDLIEKHISANNQAVLNMLNTRYIIGGQPGQEQVQRNPGALGNAWLVQQVQVVPNANAEIDALSNFDPASTAIVHEEFAGQLSSRSYSGSGTISLTDYAPDRLKYSANLPASGLAVFSEMWYGPNKGWKVSIDGQEANLIRANYALRALEIPAGNHTIEMWFEPAKFYQGETISYIASGLVLALTGLALFFGLNTGFQGQPREDGSSPADTQSETVA